MVVVFCVVGRVFAGAQGPGVSPDPATLSVQELADYAREAEAKDDPLSAFRLYTTALARDPKNRRLQSAVARTGKRVQKRTEAERARQIDRYTRDAQKRLALTAAQEADLRNRLAEGRELMKVDRSFGAANVFREIQEEAPGFREVQPHIEDLQRHFARGLKRDKFPSVTHRLATHGVYSYFRSDWPASMEALNLALKTDPMPPDLAEARLGDVLASARAHEERRVRQAEREEQMTKAIRAQEAGRFADAQAALTNILKKNPGDVEARERLAAVQKMLVGVKATVAEERKKDEIPDLLARGSLLAVQGRSADALVVFNRVLELDPQNAEAREQIREIDRTLRGEGLEIATPVVYDNAEKAYSDGLRAYGNEEYDKAKKAFQEALRLNPKHRDAKEALNRLKEAK